MNKQHIKVLAPGIGRKVKVFNKEYENGSYDGTITGVMEDQLLVEHPGGSDSWEPIGTCELIPEPDDHKTEAVGKCTTFEELYKAIEQHAPFISYSREVPEEHSALSLKNYIDSIRKGDRVTRVTRACGIRDKVMELLDKERNG